MTDEKIESYIVRGEDGTIVSLKPGYVRIPYNEFTRYTEWGMYECEEYALGILHKTGTAKQKQWIEDVLEDINFHHECALLHKGKYEEYEKCVEKEWSWIRAEQERRGEA